MTTELWMIIFYCVGTAFGVWLGYYTRNLIQADAIIEALAEAGVVRCTRDDQGRIEEILTWDGRSLDDTDLPK